MLTSNTARSLASVSHLVLALTLAATAAAQNNPGATSSPGPAATTGRPTDWPPWTPVPSCTVERRAISPLCQQPATACALVDDVQLQCSGADMAFAASRQGGHVLFTHPVRSRPRRLASVTLAGVEFSGPLPWDGEAGSVQVDPAGQPHVFLYGLQPAGGVGHAWLDAGAWRIETVATGSNALATAVAFDPEGAVRALLSAPSGSGPATLATRAASGTWQCARLAEATLGWPAVAMVDGRSYSAAFRAGPSARELVLEMFQGERRIESLKLRRRVDVAPVVRLAPVGSASPGGASLIALYPTESDLVASVPARGGRRDVRLVRLYGQTGNTCQVPDQGPCPAEGATCTRVEEGGGPAYTALVADASGRVWVAWVEARATTTLRLGTVYSTALPHAGQQAPPRDPGHCLATAVHTVPGTTLVLAALDEGRVRESLRVPLDGATLGGLHREGTDLVLGLTHQSGAFRSITVKVDRLR